MTPDGRAPYTDTQRMHLRGLVRVAAEIVGQYWPMRMFVHHNPLHGFEHLPFDVAVRQAETFLGGEGFLSNAAFRAYLRGGRIQLRHVDGVLRSIAGDARVVLGNRLLTHHEVLRARLVHALEPPAEDVIEASVQRHPDRARLEAVADRFAKLIGPADAKKRVEDIVQTDRAALGRSLTLAAWCDRTAGTRVVSTINEEMIKWCAGYLDEGHAAWAMPSRDKGFYETWRTLASQEATCGGIADSRRKILALPDHPEDAVLQALGILGVPTEQWQEYVALHLAALPGWAAFIRWRSDQTDYPWQQAYPSGLVKYLAVRLWYERELVQAACDASLGVMGSFGAISAYMEEHPCGYVARRAHTACRLPAHIGEEAEMLRRAHADPARWQALGERYMAQTSGGAGRAARYAAAWRVGALARVLEIPPTAIDAAALDTLGTVHAWLAAFAESAHGPVWLRALEAGYQEPLLESLGRRAPEGPLSASEAPRPDAQAVFCIDVRSEPFRRHLEAQGRYETFGFAGFFAVFIRYQGWGRFHETEQFPVVAKAKNTVREIPKTYLDHSVAVHISRDRLLRAGHTLLHDLKENAVTPYVMVESIGWFFALQFFGKTLVPRWYRRITAWLHRLMIPAIGTTLTVDKLPKASIEDALAAEQRATISRALHDRFGRRALRVPAADVEALRLRALNGNGAGEPCLGTLGLTAESEAAFIEELRRRYRIQARWAAVQKERITRTGFTLEEQVYTVEMALRMMGLTTNFARVVLICGHGSTSDNNPFEAALDCGACGGNEGKPNARVLAIMANRRPVRERLAQNGLSIPLDTHFVAGQVNTTTDEVELFDLDELPETHRNDIERIRTALLEAGRLTSQERVARLPDVGVRMPLKKAARQTRHRSADWSQVRPEWGLSGNAAFIIGRRAITRGLNLGGRVFLHSYDYREDRNGRLLEGLMTAPQMVAQWINMEHYFSTVANEIYGAGSKIYHNVVARIGVMTGPHSDLRIGLARQTLMNGEVPYHEAMRLMTIIEAPRARIETLIRRHEMLQHYYHNEWVHLVALDPEDRALYRYAAAGVWSPVEAEPQPVRVQPIGVAGVESPSRR